MAPGSWSWSRGSRRGRANQRRRRSDGAHLPRGTILGRSGQAEATPGSPETKNFSHLPQVWGIHPQGGETKEKHSPKATCPVSGCDRGTPKPPALYKHPFGKLKTSLNKCIQTRTLTPQSRHTRVTARRRCEAFFSSTKPPLTALWMDARGFFRELVESMTEGRGTACIEYMYYMSDDVLTSTAQVRWLIDPPEEVLSISPSGAASPLVPTALTPTMLVFDDCLSTLWNKAFHCLRMMILEDSTNEFSC